MGSVSIHLIHTITGAITGPLIEEKKAVIMAERILHCYHHQLLSTIPSLTLPCNSHQISRLQALKPVNSGHHQWQGLRTRIPPLMTSRMKVRPLLASASPLPQQPLDLTEDNVRQVLADARVELSQLFDDSVGITGNPLYISLSLA